MKVIEKIIEAAIQRGEFEALHGEGRRLDLSEPPLQDPTWRLAYRMLKEQGYTLPWLELRKEIEGQLEQARRSLQAALPGRGGESGEGRSIELAVNEFRARLAEMEPLIQRYNLMVPLDRFQMIPLDPERELARLTAAGSAGEHAAEEI